MKPFRIFYLLILGSLFGCNTLVTKPVIDEPNNENINQAIPSSKLYRIDVEDNLPELVNQDNSFTLYWKNETVAPKAKLTVDLAKNTSEKSKIANKRIKRIYYTARQKIARNTPTIGEAISKAIKIIPEKRRFNSKKSFKNRNLWDQVKNGYAFPAVDNHQVQKEINKFLSNPAYFRRISTKAKPYFYHIVKEVEKRGLPMELALLPAIESAFEPRAISHKSAAGLWQFMPATGRYYGLTQNKWYDGRRDIAESTNAALNYLKTLHKMFDGDWFLALAAYNYGEGNVGKAIRRNKKSNRPTDFWSLKLPRETREYVPKLLAFAKIVANPRAYGIKLQKISNKPYFRKINIGRQTELSVVAQLAGISLSDLKVLNPCYRRGITSPRGPHNISLPASKVYQFKQRLAQIPSELKLVKTVAFTNKLTVTNKLPNRSKKTYRKFNRTKNLAKYQVRKGDTLWKIAKRHNMNVAKIRSLNKLSRNASLRIGQKLVISAVKNIKTITKKHRVRRGDNLWEIAKHYGTTVSLLKRLNKFNNNSLKVGKFLVIPN
ncbi:MAG: LysM peptidoglycan-binding domain-containing protein [Candidatus Marithrix sp.]